MSKRGLKYMLFLVPILIIAGTLHSEYKNNQRIEKRGDYFVKAYFMANHDTMRLGQCWKLAFIYNGVPTLEPVKLNIDYVFIDSCADVAVDSANYYSDVLHHAKTNADSTHAIRNVLYHYGMSVAYHNMSHQKTK